MPFGKHLFESFVHFKNWVICVDLSLQENGDRMKPLNLGNDYLREKVDTQGQRALCGV